MQVSELPIVRTSYVEHLIQGLVKLAFHIDYAAASPRLVVPRRLAQYLVVRSRYQRVHIAVCYNHLLSRRKTMLIGHIVGIDLLRDVLVVCDL